jgi:hypothetical protein
MSKSGTVITVASRVCAIAIVVAGLPLLWYGQVADAAMANAPIQFALHSGELRVTAVNTPEARRLVSVGDTIDTADLSSLQRVFPAIAALRGQATYRVHHDGTAINVTLQPPEPPSADQVGSRFRLPWVLVHLIVQSISLLVAALVLWRSPGAIAFFFAWFAAGAPIQIGAIAYLLVRVPDPLFTALIAASAVMFALGPTLALVEFAVLFPGGTVARATRWRRVLEAGLAVTLALYAADTYFTGVWRTQPHDLFFDTVVPLAATLLTLAIIIVKYAVTSGQDRRRVAWVLAGVAVSSVAYAAAGFPYSPLNEFPLAKHIAQALFSALPILLAYAILRHRVIDVGFALNRTLVYAMLTGTVLVGVSAVDWLSEHYIASTNASLALDALIAIAFGVALNRLHRWVEALVDRVFFRERHRAFSTIAARIRALDYAESSDTVDEALASEPARILRLGSAAVFRVTENGEFSRVAAIGWDAGSTVLPSEHVLLRTLRADERTIVLADREIGGPEFPSGAQQPDIAIPIGLRHQLLGCVIYGHREGDAILDPEECGLLEQLAHAASVAYDAIEATRWRNRALAFENA